MTMVSACRNEIRLFDRVLVEFSIDDGLFALQVAIEDADADALALVPRGLSLDPEAIWRWLKIRSIPTRKLVEFMHKSIKLAVCRGELQVFPTCA